jgi:hypothetical protein
MRTPEECNDWQLLAALCLRRCLQVDQVAQIITIDRRTITGQNGDQKRQGDDICSHSHIKTVASTGSVDMDRRRSIGEYKKRCSTEKLYQGLRWPKPSYNKSNLEKRSESC